MNLVGMIARDVFGQTSATDTGAQATDQARYHRCWMAALAASISSYWVGPYIPLVWFGMVLVYELTLANPLIDNFITPFNRTAPNKARMRGVALSVAASLLYICAWAPAYLTGKPGTELFATAWVGCAMIHALVYARPDPWMLWGSIAPALAAIVLGSFVMHGWTVTPFVALLIIGRLTLSTATGHRDRMILLANVKLNRNQRKAADEANAAKSDFLATMSHELRTPLNAIIGYSEILEEELNELGNKNCAADALRIQRAGRNLLSLINEVLDFSKIEAGRLDLVEVDTDAAALLHDAVDTCAPTAAANNTKVDIEMPATLGTLVLDAGRFKQCLLNLLSNACKFTKDGVVTIRASIETHATGETLVVSVKDTGVGIAADQAGRLFKPFVQANSSKTRTHEGTGLGLVITKRLAELMGGDVSFESTLGAGSCFTIYVAAKRPAEERKREIAQADGPAIVAFEDDRAALDMYDRICASLSMRMIAAHSAENGIALIRAAAPQAILMDVHLEGPRSGWDLLSEIQADAALKTIPVFVVSTEDNRAKSLALGARDHFTKPVARDQIIAALRACTPEPLARSAA